MAGLIPLRLQPAAPGSRSSMMFGNTCANPQTPPPTAQKQQQHTQQQQQQQQQQQKQQRPTHARHSSMSSIPPTTRCSSIISSPPSKSSRAMKHVSQPILPTLPVLPYTPAEWKRAMIEIKRHHVARRFRACSARCVEILENLKDTSTVEPAHLIYLHFYAANSLEMCARPFATATPARSQLLTQARSHYDQAAALIQKAEMSVTSKTRSGSAISSSMFSMRSSCLHSPSGSVSSGTWSTPTTNSSPTNSVCSFDDMLSKSSSPRSSAMAQTPRSAKAKKTVSFSLPKEETFKFPAEPYIRPDSPTLGFDDAYFASPITRQVLPEVPKAPAAVEVIREEDEETDEPRRMREWEERGPSPFSDPLDDDDYDRRTARSVYRYCEALSSLRAQIASHSANLDELMREPMSATARPSSPVRSSSPVVCIVAGPGASDEMLALDRKARIERLRREGWQRKRFDASRYERLCNEALAELC